MEKRLLKLRNYVLGFVANSAANNSEKLVLPGIIYYRFSNENGTAHLMLLGWWRWGAGLVFAKGKLNKEDVECIDKAQYWSKRFLRLFAGIRS